MTYSIKHNEEFKTYEVRVVMEPHPPKLMVEFPYNELGHRFPMPDESVERIALFMVTGEEVDESIPVMSAPASMTSAYAVGKQLETLGILSEEDALWIEEQADEYAKNAGKELLKQYRNPTRSVHNDFMAKYSKDHAACPRCGGLDHTTTLAGYIFDASCPQDYRNLNKCECLACRDKHTYHDRVPAKEEGIQIKKVI